MSGKGLVWGGMFVGSAVGGSVPYLWGGGFIAYSLFGALGGLVGIWAGFKLAKWSGAL